MLAKISTLGSFACHWQDRNQKTAQLTKRAFVGKTSGRPLTKEAHFLSDKPIFVEIHRTSYMTNFFT